MSINLHIKANNNQLFHTLKRYFKYIFNIEEVVALEENKVSKHSLIFIEEDNDINDDWLNFFIKHPYLKIVILGLTKKSNESYINLLDLSSLKTNIQTVINSNRTQKISPLLKMNKIEQQIRFLFKSHGEESLLDKLDKTIHLLKNGINLLKENILDWGEYVKTYLKPGLENWIEFINNFMKYKIYLEACGFNKELKLIEKNINLFDNFLNKLKYFDKAQTCKINEKTISMNFNYANQIINALFEIKEKKDSIHHD